MGVFLPRRWRHQPPAGSAVLDTRNPLTRDLAVFCMGHDLFFPERLPYEDNAFSGGAPVSRAYSTQGASLEFARGEYRVADEWVANTTRYSGTLLASVTPMEAVSDDRYGLVSARDRPEGGARFYLRRNTNGTCGFGLNGSASLYSGPVWPVGVVGVISGSWGSSNTAFYFNGKREYTSSSTLTVKPGYLTINGVVIASSSKNHLNYSSHTIHHHCGVWNRPLSDDEHREMAQAPYQIFKPRRHSFYSFPVGDIVPNIPTLSLPGVTNITDTSARPHVTITF